MTNKEHITGLIRDHEPQIRALGVKSLGLFGSFVREEQRQDSDVDLLYEFEDGAATLKNFSGLHDLLKEVLQHEIELVPRKFLSPYLGPHILEEVELILE